MPLPIILGIGAIVAGVEIYGAVKVKEAKDTINEAQDRHERNTNRFEKEKASTKESIEKLEKLKIQISNSFQKFSDIFVRIQNKPNFKEYSKNGIVLPRYDGEDLPEVSVDRIIMRWSVVACSGKDMMLSHMLSKKADELWDQMKKAEENIDKICTYLEELKRTANSYLKTMVSVNTMYEKHLAQMQDFVVEQSHKDWNKFTNEEQLITENTVLLVGLLYNMCKVELVLKNKNEEDMNIINKDAVAKSINNAGIIMNEIEHKESFL